MVVLWVIREAAAVEARRRKDLEERRLKTS